MPTTNSTMPNDRTKSLCDLSGNSSKTARNSTTITTTNSNKKSKSTPNTPQKTSERSKCLIVASNSNSLRSKKSTKDETFVWSGWQQQQIVHDFFFSCVAVFLFVLLYCKTQTQKNRFISGWFSKLILVFQLFGTRENGIYGNQKKI